VADTVSLGVARPQWWSARIWESVGKVGLSRSRTGDRQKQIRQHHRHFYVNACKKNALSAAAFAGAGDGRKWSFPHRIFAQKARTMRGAC
jgi:hypothetical protein